MENWQPPEEEEIEIIEMLDENGEPQLFELLETMEEEGATYLILTPYDEDDDDSGDYADVFVMKEGEVDGQPIVETVKDWALAERIFETFKQRSAHLFEFTE